MNRDETIRVMQKLKIMYPNQFPRTKEEKLDLLNIWSKHFEEFNCNDVMNAIQERAHTEQGKYMPTIFEISDIVISATTALDELVKSYPDLKLINGIYHYGDNFNETYDWKNDPLNITKRSVYDFSLNDEETEAERQRLLNLALEWQEELRREYGTQS